MDAVVCLRNFNDEINYIGDGEYEVGASVRLQKLITHVNSNGYGGIEYMYSIPGLLGGAIYMNAGTGRVTNKSIGNSIESVAVFYNGKLQEYSRDECQFGYRSSIFQKRPGSVILGAKLKFEPIDEDKAKSRIKERMDHCRETQDRSAPNVGTVFCESNDRIMNYFMKKGIGYVDGCVFSSKTKNWMLHREQGTFEQAMELIQRVQRAHRLFRKKCRTEVVIWK